MAMADLPPLSSSSSPSSSSPQFPSLFCAHCELSPATEFCRDESLLYCSPCSSSLHSKKARAHHIVMPLRVCDQCEKYPASLTCSLCGGSGEPLAFCAPCSSDLHSRKARSHHQLVAISVTGLYPGNLGQSRKYDRKQNGSDICGDDDEDHKQGSIRNPKRIKISEDEKSSLNRLHEAKRSKKSKQEVKEEKNSKGQRKPLVDCQPLLLQDSKKKKKNNNNHDKEKKDDIVKKKKQDQKKDTEKKKVVKGEDQNNFIKQENTSPMQSGGSLTSTVLTNDQNQETIYLSDDSSSDSEHDASNAKKKEMQKSEEYLNNDRDANKENASLVGCHRANPNSRVLRSAQNQRAHYLSDELTAASDDDSISESESNHDTSDDDETYGTKKYHKGSVTLEAFVVNVESEEEGNIRRGCSAENQVEEGVHGRIRKMLELGLHPDTPDFEAQQALKNAQRLLTKHNLQQADILKGDLENDKNAFEGGMRIVDLRSKDKKRAGCVAHWLYSLARTVAEYFDTQYFVQKRSTIQIVFYGIKQNVECAAYAFAATFNRISKLSADFVPTKMMKSGQGKANSGSSHSVHSRVSRMSYRTGLVEGLFETVRASKKQHHETKKKSRGTKEQNAELDYTKGLENREDTGCDNSEEETFPLCSEDSDDENVNKPHSSSKVWEKENVSAITALVVHSKKVAEDFLKEMKVKVRTRKHNNPIIWDGEAFRKGKRDSKTIDIGQKALTRKAKRAWI